MLRVAVENFGESLLRAGNRIPDVNDLISILNFLRVSSHIASPRWEENIKHQYNFSVYSKPVEGRLVKHKKATPKDTLFFHIV